MNVLAKNLKLQIKNSQLAEAINIRGLKAKLSKKKADGGGDSGEEDHVKEHDKSSALSHENAEENSSSSKGKAKKKNALSKKDSEENSFEQPESQSLQKESTAFSQKSPADIKQKDASSSPTNEHFEVPTFSSLEAEVEKKQPQAVASEKNIEKPKPQGALSSDKPVERVAEKEVKEEISLKQTVEHAANKKEPSFSQPAAKHTEEKSVEPKTPPLFLSATRKNPDLLGPVLDRPVRVAPSQDNSRSSDRFSEGRRADGGGQRYDSPRSQDRYPSQSRSSPQQPREPFSRSQQPRERDGGSYQPRDSQSREYPPRERDGGSYQPRESQSREYPPRERDGGYRGRSQDGSGQGGFQPRGASSGQERTYGPRQGHYSGPRQGGPSHPGASSGEGGGYRSGGPQSGRPFGPRTPYSSGSQPPYGRRSDSGPSGGFKPQPFVTRPSQDSAKQAPGWDRAQPQKEGAEERAQQRRHMAQNESEEKKTKFKDTKEGKTAFKKPEGKDFDSRLRHGLHTDDDEDRGGWKKKRKLQSRDKSDLQEPIRPTKIKVRLPITVKDLAQEMKLKASQLIGKLFLQGLVVTLNDLLDDETIVQILGQEFGCEVGIDTSEQERLKLAEKSIKEEIEQDTSEKLILRPPVIAFMGHVDHGKTSLIDSIRQTNRVQGEVGAITQHIGAFSCMTSHGPITILDTPGHEAFSAMRERGAEITDIAILVVAGDEGMKEQTVEAMNQAKASHSTIVVAINKCDKPNFDQEKVYRQLADHELLPEAWGGQTITVNCSAVTGEGIQSLLEMVALQSEVLELKANPEVRARGTVIESEMFKGLGPVATVLVQNGSLKLGDCVVFDFNWAKIKSMKDDSGRDVLVAGPSMPVRINGLSGFPEAGEEFVVVSSEKEARAISEARQEGRRQLSFQVKKKFSLESMAEKTGIQKKVLNVILRADVQGSLEALKTALMKIESKKVDLNIVSMGVGEISESDVQLANASKATIIGFHTQVESHAEPMMKELGVQYKLHDIIYHAHDDVRDMMKALLDKIPQENDKGKAEVRATFKSSQLGVIAGCQVLDGSITRNCSIRLIRGGSIIWKGGISSLKRFKDDVKEVTKGTECGILLNGFSDYQVGDVLEAFEVTYLTQEL